MKDENIYPTDVGAVALVGGAGSRLGPLSWPRAKPAVMAGNTILAAFSTSNAENSGINRIVLAAQHLPRSLKRFYSKAYGSDYGPEKLIDITDPLEYATQPVYKGTADAFFKSLEIARFDKRFILGLSGDHIYNMDFRHLFEALPEYNPETDFVIVSTEVAGKDAHRFGILLAEGNKVVDFKEKPTGLQEQKYLANTAIYLASSKVWYDLLRADQGKIAWDKTGEKDPAAETEYDIAKDVIQDAKRRGVRLLTYKFDGYWRDVGTPYALHEAYMEIFIKREPDIMGNKKHRIAALSEPQFHSNGEVYFTTGRFEAKNSKLNGSVFSHGVKLNGAEVLDSIVMGGTEKDTIIEKGSYIRRSILDKEVYVGSNVRLNPDGDSLIVVARKSNIPSNTLIEGPHGVLVAPLEELIINVRRLIEFRQDVSPNVELVTPDGRNISFDELRELVSKRQSIII